MKISEKYGELAFPFSVSEIEWRLLLDKEFNGQRKGLVAPYVRARAIQDRLDQVVGAEHWQSNPVISTIQSKELVAVTCRIGIYDDDIGWVWKGDGAGGTNYEPIKGGFSGALKRAASQWSIGRYLYYLSDFWTPCIIKKEGKYELTRTADVDDLNGQYNKALTVYMKKHNYSAEDIRRVTENQTTTDYKRTSAASAQKKTNPHTSTPQDTQQNKAVYEVVAIRNNGKNSLLALKNAKNETSYVFVLGVTTLMVGNRITNAKFKTTMDKGSKFTYLEAYNVAA